METNIYKYRMEAPANGTAIISDNGESSSGPRYHLAIRQVRDASQRVGFPVGWDEDFETVGEAKNAMERLLKEKGIMVTPANFLY